MVTSGRSNNLKIFTYYKGARKLPSNVYLRKVILLAKELEKLTGMEALDIELAADEDNLFLLQVDTIFQIEVLEQSVDLLVGCVLDLQ